MVETNQKNSFCSFNSKKQKANELDIVKFKPKLLKTSGQISNAHNMTAMH